MHLSFLLVNPVLPLRVTGEKGGRVPIRCAGISVLSGVPPSYLPGNTYVNDGRGTDSSWVFLFSSQWCFMSRETSFTCMCEKCIIAFLHFIRIY